MGSQQMRYGAGNIQEHTVNVTQFITRQQITPGRGRLHRAVCFDFSSQSNIVQVCNTVRSSNSTTVITFNRGWTNAGRPFVRLPRRSMLNRIIRYRPWFSMGPQPTLEQERANIHTTPIWSREEENFFEEMEAGMQLLEQVVPDIDDASASSDQEVPNMEPGAPVAPFAPHLASLLLPRDNSPPPPSPPPPT